MNNLISPPKVKFTSSFSSSEGLISDWLLVESMERGEPISNLKLQKLLYYSQAWFLATSDSELFQEDFQAWIHGPVLPSQYRRFSSFGWRPIEHDPTMIYNANLLHKSQMTAEIEKHLMEIVDVFGSETAIALEQMTHSEEPWIEARSGIPATQSSTSIISKSKMKTFYQGLI